MSELIAQETIAMLIAAAADAREATREAREARKDLHAERELAMDLLRTGLRREVSEAVAAELKVTLAALSVATKQSLAEAGKQIEADAARVHKHLNAVMETADKVIELARMVRREQGLPLTEHEAEVPAAFRRKE